MRIREMAKAAGVSAATVSRFARGKHVDEGTLIALINAQDKELAAEVTACLGYLRTALSRHSQPERWKHPRVRG